MKKDDLTEALATIVDEQETCAPVELSIGSTDEASRVQHLTLFLRDAPSKVIDALIDQGFTLSIDWRGLAVERI